MLPIPISSIMYLIQSGYPTDLVLRIFTDSVNGLKNYYSGPGRPQAGDPKFREFITAIWDAQSEGGLGMRAKSVQDRQTILMFVRPSTVKTIAAPVRKARELLNLNTTAHEFTVSNGTYPENDTEITILSRSQWFWIYDRDKQSKQIFNSIMLMFSLTDTRAGKSHIEGYALGSLRAKQLNLLRAHICSFS